MHYRRLKRCLRRRYLRASTVGPSNISDASYYGVMPFSRQLRDIESSIRERRAATALPPPVSTYWRAFASPYGRDSKASIKLLSLMRKH